MRGPVLARLLFVVVCSLLVRTTALAGEFLEAPLVKTGASPHGVAAGDLNGDGYTDLVRANFSSNQSTLSVLLNNGDGTFQAHVDFATAEGPLELVSADLNNDGKLDLAVTHNGFSSQGLCIHLGNGDGTFQTGVEYGTGDLPGGLTVGDFNHDGNLDVAVAQAGPNSVGVFLGNGDGSLRARQDFTTGFDPVAVAVGDFNKDGNPDLVLADEGDPSGSFSLLLGNGNGTFQPAMSQATGLAFPDTVSVADLNGDGNLDIAIAGSGLSVYLGNGDGTFQSSYSSIVGPIRLVISDVNRDGKLDLVGSGAYIYLGNGDGTFQSPLNYRSAIFLAGVAVADLTGDGIPDIAQVDQQMNANLAGCYVLAGNGDGTFLARSAYFPDAQASRAAAADFNHDRKNDLLVSNSGSASVTLLLNSSAGILSSAGDYPVGPGPEGVATGDFSGDGVLDAVTANNLNNTISVLLNNGDGTFKGHVDYGTGNLPYGIAAGDLNRDGKIDLVTGNQSGTISIFRGNGDGSFQAHTEVTVGIGIETIALGDLNGDGNLDAVVSNNSSSASTVAVLLGNGDGTFGSAALITAGNRPESLVLADVNGDEKLDIATANLSANTVSVLLGNGDGRFQAHRDYAVGRNPVSIAAGDINGDGHMDLAVDSTDSNSASVLLGKGDGTFLPRTDYAIDSFSSFILLANLNADRAIDIAAVNAGSVTVLLNTGGTTVKASSTPNPSHQGQPVAFSVRVTGSLHGSAAPTGTVTFLDGNMQIARVTLSSGVGKFKTSTLSGGTHHITTSYSGDAAYNPNTGNTITQIVQ